MLLLVCAACGDTPTTSSNGPLAWAIADTLGPRGAVGEVVIKSTNGGQTWNVQSTIGGQPSLQAIQFLDRDAGWLVGGTVFLHSSDGGATWTDEKTRLPSSNLGFGGIVFNGPNGVAVGSEFNVDDPTGGRRLPAAVFTTDGGITWMRGSVPSRTGMELKSVCLRANGGGIAAGTGISGGTLLIRTVDGGATWDDITDRAPLADIVACTPDDLWALGGGIGQTSVLRSLDGGDSWMDLSSAVPVSAGTDAVDFTDTVHGWMVAAGAGGSIVLRTADAGKSWMEDTPPFDQRLDLRAIRFTRGGQGLVIGSELSIENSPLVFFSSGSGTTWQAGTLPEAVFAVVDVSIVP